jgi:hypothetical protein
MPDTPILRSPSTLKSLWQEYRIYEDRLEFDTHVGRLTVPFANIERVDVHESDVKGLLRGDLRLRNFRAALKLDWANFAEHVALDTASGLLRRILFTPENPRAFKGALDAALAGWQDRHQSPP